jgi:ribonuclease Z
MSFKLTILGCNSAIPTTERKPTAQLLNVAERFFLIDCGEGTQLQLRKYKFKMQSINHIFISHLHGDHYFGLIGLISTMHLLGREKELHIYGPIELKDIIYVQLSASKTELRYPLFFHSFGFDNPQNLMEDENIVVQTIPLDHSISCCGFLFKEKNKARRMRREKIEEYNIPSYLVPKIKQGGDFTTPDGTVVPHLELTRGAQKSRSYAFCSDTSYMPKIVDCIKGVDILYHEATFLDDMKLRAQQTKHSTAKQAATIAKMADVGKLIIGHYSQRYYDLDPLLQEAKSVFESSFLAVEGETHELIRTYL